ncbi:hypothetical protein GCM10020001_040130 [Nonomuraea salmonea]
MVALSDGGGVKSALPRPVVGADAVARLLSTGWWRTDAKRTVEPVHINGSPALLIRLDGEIDGVLAVHVDNGHVTGAYHVRNPEKLSHINRPTTVSR